jgi:hypothetical protein
VLANRYRSNSQSKRRPRINVVLDLNGTSTPLLTLPLSGAGVVVQSDDVGNLKVAVGRATEAGCIAGAGKLLRWGFADWANEGHGC